MLTASERPGTQNVVDLRPPPRKAGFPLPRTTMFGREAEQARLVRLLAEKDVPLVTITGPGGVGKTRLALSVVHEAAASFVDDAAVVSLAAIDDRRLIAPAMAHALGLRDSGQQSASEQVLGFLRQRQMLLVLDNLEQVVDCAPFIADLLHACPGVTMLVTSRRPLRIGGEQEFPLAPLLLPSADEQTSIARLAANGAVQVFITRTRSIVPGFSLTEENARAVAAICCRLDGLPLAIELAAARGKVLSPAALLARLASRLDVLTQGGTDRPERHQTMRDAIAWSYDLLSHGEQAAFRWLAVCSGSFSLTTAEALIQSATGTNSPAKKTPDTAELDLISALLDASLVQRTEEMDEEPRFAMLETIREFALDMARERGELAAAQGTHARHVLHLAAAAEARLRGPEQRATLARLEADHDNLRAALAWSVAAPERADTALRLTGALHWFWYLRGHYHEGRQWLEAALARPGAAEGTLVHAEALLGAGVLAFPQGDFAGARERMRQCIAIGRTGHHPRIVAYALYFLAADDLPHADHAVARQQIAESVALFREAGDRWGLAMALRGLGLLAIITRQFDEAAAPFAESLALNRELGDRWLLARVLHYTGELERYRGDDERAQALYQESLALYDELDLRYAAAIVLHNLGHIAQHRGNPRLGLAYFSEALTRQVEHDDRLNIGHCLAGVAGTIAKLERPEPAARLFSAADALLATMDAAIWPVDRVDYERNLAGVRSCLGEATFARAWAEGQGMSLDAAVAEALRWRVLDDGRLDHTPGHPADAGAMTTLTTRQREVLTLLVEGRTDREIADTLAIGRRTVETHVANLFTKLKVNSRAEAAAGAVRRGLV